MKKQILLIHLLSTICWVQLVNGQLKEQTLSVASGISLMAKQDLVYSPFIHADASRHSYRLKYQLSGKYLQFAEIGFTYNTSQLVESYELDMDDHSHMILPHEFLNFNIIYGFGKSVQTKADYSAWIGGAIQSDLQAGYYNFGLSTMFGYLIDQSAQVWYRRAYDFNHNHLLTVQVAVPVISWLSRPPYLAEDDEFIENISSHNSAKIFTEFIGDGKLATWNSLQRVNLAAEYKYLISKGVHIGLEYRFDFVHTNLPKTLLSYQHQFNISGTLKL